VKIQIDPHTLERAEERGTNEEEIIEVIKTGYSIPAKYEKEGKAKIYDFRKKRHNINIMNKRRLRYFMLPSRMQ